MSQSSLESSSLRTRRSFIMVDVIRGFLSGIWYSKTHLFHSYFIVPIGLIVILVTLYGLNQLILEINIKFPASVLGLLLNLLLLCSLSWLSNLNKPTYIKKPANWILTNYLGLIKPSMNFTLKWINVFFIPSFIVLPLSSPITFIECLKIAGVFVIGMILLILVDVYFLRLLKLGYGKIGYVIEERDHQEHEDEVELETLSSGNDDLTTIDLTSLVSAKEEDRNQVVTTRSKVISENPFTSSTPPSMVDIPEPSYQRDGSSNMEPQMGRLTRNVSYVEQISIAEQQEQELLTRMEKVTLFTIKYIDWILYFILFVVSLPIYYSGSIHVYLPYHLSITILAYYFALTIPQRFPVTKKFAHPILISTGEILFICFIGSLIDHRGKPEGFLIDLRYYKTGRNYLNLFNTREYPNWPGCGDVLSSLMDISIVSLSLPMFTHRRDFIKNFWVLFPTLLVSVVLTFFLYPITCHAIGIEPTRSIGFIGRSVTLALGTPLVTSLGGSVSLMAVCTILSGIIGVLINEPMFKLLGVPKNDYVVRGVTLGINCGAIATAHLLNVDPRAASISSLSFGVFGTIMVIMASIEAIRELIRSWVGL
ncbi:Plastidal glycolate/glycerate translocator 1 [Spathaspora sp. JA1]|nr:Plastidal glycolate/glycerate translocator 1 [Spathaspora sp. JA1]